MRSRSLVGSAACWLVVLGWTAVAGAAVKLPAVIADNMVLQRGQPVPIWGWADKGEEVTLTIANQKLTTKAGDDGRWKVELAKLDAGQPLEMTVRGSSGAVLTRKNILVGEVWVGSGQSNMELPVAACKNAQQEIASAEYPQIRLFSVAKAKAAEPQTDCAGDWKPCSPATVPGFSAAAYFFGRQLYKELNVPIGLIHTSWGGTAAQSWTSRKALEANPVLKPLAQGESSYLYNAMIAPLMPYAIRGAIWYQGEANVGGAYQYRTLFPAMIADWRSHWGQGDFPFGFVQIAPFSYSDAWGANPACCAELWEAQAMTLNAAPNTGMVVTVDIADVEFIHPKNKDYRGIHPTNKQDVGRRLALWALAKVYGRSLVYCGPIYQSMAVEGNKIRLKFDHVGGGLMASDNKPLSDFTIAGADRNSCRPRPASTATRLSPTAITSRSRWPYALHGATTPRRTFSNKEGLPASPFRTDTWKGVTQP